jgi:hypothetical protein
MTLVIALLEKELERQNLLILANERAKEDPENSLYKYTGLPEVIYPNMVQLRDQLEEAIAYLKTK